MAPISQNTDSAEELMLSQESAPGTYKMISQIAQITHCFSALAELLAFPLELMSS